MNKHHFMFIAAIFFMGVAATCAADAQNTAQAGSSPLLASNLGNPNISAIGWFQSEAGHRAKNADQAEAFGLKEAELGFQGVVDPYARADFFISVHDQEIDLEEGYINWFSLPGDLALKVGKFRANFGKFNRTHTPETAFADRPLVAQNFFGEEGLSGTGVSLSWQMPNPLFLTNLDLETFNTPDTSDVPVFGKARKGDLTYVGRLSSYFDLSEEINLTAGGSYSYGAAGQELNVVSQSSTTLHSQLYGVDATFRWKNPRRAIYRSAFWQTEFIAGRHENTTSSFENSWGMFSHLEYQFAQRWKSGGRYDYSETPTNRQLKDRGGLLYITFTPTEFSSISLQGRHVTYGTGEKEDIGFLKVTFNIGPHGAHPF